MKEEKLKGNFTYNPQQTEYIATVKKRYQWWWWLLLLLIFVPLFIRCERTITVKVVDAEGNPVEAVDVSLSYTAHYFLASPEDFDEKETTDAKGKVVFDGLECSVYSYLFHRSETMTVTAEPPSPYMEKSETAPFHTTDEVKIVLDEIGMPMNVQVVDNMDGSPLAGAEVVVTRRGSGLGTYITDSQGMATIPDVKRSDKLSIAGRKAGYETNDTTLGSIQGRDLNVQPPLQIPLQKKFECNDDINFKGNGEFSSKVDMHQSSGICSVTFFTYDWPDRLIIYEEDGTQIFDSGLVTINMVPQLYTNIPFHSRYLTFRIIPDPQHPMDSAWELFPHCPN